MADKKSTEERLKMLEEFVGRKMYNEYLYNKDREKSRIQRVDPNMRDLASGGTVKNYANGGGVRKAKFMDN